MRRSFSPRGWRGWSGTCRARISPSIGTTATSSPASISSRRIGIPDDAYKPLTGDDKTVAADLKKRNRNERQGQLTLDFDAKHALIEAPLKLAPAFARLAAVEDRSPEDVHRKEEEHRRFRESETYRRNKRACDLWCAAFFTPLQKPERPGRDVVPTNEVLSRCLAGKDVSQDQRFLHAEGLADKHSFFHWKLEFPDVFAPSPSPLAGEGRGEGGGFDVALGNPPWERIKLQNQEFFAARDREIAKAPNAAECRKLIERLPQTNPALAVEFEAAKRAADAASRFVRVSGRFPLTAVGDVNTYALFAELFLTLIAPTGRAGFIAPTGIATDDSTKAELWRINHGWRRSPDSNGFTIEQSTGRWQPRQGIVDDEDNSGPAAARRTGLKPFVKDRRNILMLRPVAEAADEAFLKTLAYALRRAIQIIYQVEEQEVAVELIGNKEHQRILLWEAAEGGIGLWERLMAGKAAFRELARQALSLIHCDSATGEDVPEWADRCPAACYDCLLSYSNQQDHRYLNRSLIVDYLQALALANLAEGANRRSYDEHYRWLCAQIDPNSSFERQFLDHLYRNHIRLPDHAQYRPTHEVAVQPDFYYERDGIPGVCVFIDGPHHHRPLQAQSDRQSRTALEDRGYRVLQIKSDSSIAEEVRRYADVFVPA